MSSANLSIRPDLCDNCGRCVRACPRGELRVGGGYIYVDATTCDGCMECASVCRTGAISARGGRGADGLAVKPGEVSRVVVSSRAEAKALRKAAEAAAAKPAARKKGESGTRTEGAAPAKPKKQAGGSTSKPLGGAAKPASRAVASKRPSVPSSDGARWGLVDAAAIAGVLLAALLAKGAVLGSEAFRLMPSDGKAFARAGVLAVFYVLQIGLVAFLAHRRGMTLPEAFRLRRGAGDLRAAAASSGLVFALLVATRLVSMGWGALAQALGWVPTRSEALSGLFGNGSVGLVVTAITVVLVGPLVEELVFRGVIAGALDLRFGMRVAIVASAAAFAAYHLTAWVAVPTFVLGIALAWLALTRETLWPAVALHALYNGVVVAAAFWLPMS